LLLRCLGWQGNPALDYGRAAFGIRPPADAAQIVKWAIQRIFIFIRESLT
jgi:hypothetical protein